MVFENIIRFAQKEQVDFLFITGDLYEHNYVTKSTIYFLNESFKKIHDTKVIIIPGNHDPWVEGSYYKSFNWAENVHILTDPFLTFEENEEKNVCIYGQAFLEGYKLKGYKKDYKDYKEGYEDGYKDEEHEHLKKDESVNYKRESVNYIKSTDKDKINILLLHGSVGFDFDKNSYNPISVEILASINMDYIGIGHFHNRIDKVAGLENAYNPGSPEPLGFDEPGQHGFYFGSISIDDKGNKKLEIEFIPGNRKEYLDLEVNITGCMTDEEIIEKIKESLNSKIKEILNNDNLGIKINNDDKKLNDDDDDIKFGNTGIKFGSDCIKPKTYQNLLVNISLMGYISPDFSPDIKYISSYFNDIFFFAKIKNKTRRDYDFDEIKRDFGLKGLFVRKILDLVNSTQDNEEKELLLKSLYYGLEAMEKGQVDISDY